MELYLKIMQLPLRSVQSVVSVDNMLSLYDIRERGRHWPGFIASYVTTSSAIGGV
jgi:hypothetical protein